MRIWLIECEDPYENWMISSAYLTAEIAMRCNDDVIWGKQDSDGSYRGVLHLERYPNTNYRLFETDVIEQ